MVNLNVPILTAGEDVITAITVLIPAIKKFTEKAKNTVLDESLDAIFFEPCHELRITSNSCIIYKNLWECFYTLCNFFIEFTKT